MTAQAREEVTRSAIHEPDHIILASTENGITFWMPIDEQDVITFSWPILEIAFLFENLRILSIRLPYSQNVIHATGEAQLPIKTELDKLNRFRMACEFTNLDTLKFLVFSTFDFFFSSWLNRPDVAFVVSITADKSVKWCLGDLSDTIYMILMHEGQLTS